jgi:hypothetical protein
MDVLSTIWSTLTSYLSDSGFGQFHWTNGVMLLVGGLFIYPRDQARSSSRCCSAHRVRHPDRQHPYDAGKLPLGRVRRAGERGGSRLCTITYAPEAGGPVGQTHDALMRALLAAESVRLSGDAAVIADPGEGMAALYRGEAVLVNTHRLLAPRVPVDAPGVYAAGGGRSVFVAEVGEGGRYPELWSLAKQDPHNASIFWWLFAGVGLAGFYPPLIFLGHRGPDRLRPDAEQPQDAAARRGGAVRDLREPARRGGAGLRRCPRRRASGSSAARTGPRRSSPARGWRRSCSARSRSRRTRYMAMVPIIQPRSSSCSRARRSGGSACRSGRPSRVGCVSSSRSWASCSRRCSRRAGCRFSACSSSATCSASRW